MKLNTLKPGSRKAPKRVGRGSSAGQGKTCGRGHKGQKSRSGEKAKVIASGKISRAVKVRGIKVTPGARKAIEAAGGSIEE